MKLLKSGIAFIGRKAQDLVCKIVMYLSVMPCHLKCTLHNIITLQKCEICSSCRTQCRKEETRNVEGVPLLKRGSRGKGAAIPIQAITAAAARSARQGQSLRLQIVALQILGLKQVRFH
jgi:flavoprotein